MIETKKLSLLKRGLLIFSYLLLPSLALWILERYVGSIGILEGQVWALVIYLCGLLVFLRKDIGQEVGLAKAYGLKNMLVLMLKLFGIYMVLNNLYVFVLSQYGIVFQSANQNLLEELLVSHQALMTLQILVCAPLIEEIICRYAGISFKYPYSSLLFSSLFFALLHFVPTLVNGTWNDLWTLPTYMGIGIMLGFSYLKSRSLVTSCLFHFLLNLMALLAMGFSF